MTEASSLNLCMSPHAFFKERLESASSKLQVELSEDIEFYLVNLLTDFIDPSKLNQEFESDILKTPLAFLLKQTVEAPELRQPTMYRRLGDTSLYFAGFFQDYFNDKSFDIRYFIDMGASAYDQAAQLHRSIIQDNDRAATLSYISVNFVQLVDVVAQASESDKPKNTEILHLYDRWDKSGSQRILRILLENGISPIKTPFRAAQ